MIIYKKGRKYSYEKCKKCSTDVIVRSDYLKKWSGYCAKCGSKIKWENKEYAEKQKLSHKGKKGGHSLSPGESSFNSMYSAYVNSAKKRNLIFELTKEQFREIVMQDCYYCGCKPDQKHYYTKKSNGCWVSNGIDRKDDSIGYILSNCVSSCKICNYAKQGLDDTEFLEHIKKIYEYNFLNNEVNYGIYNNRKQ